MNTMTGKLDCAGTIINFKCPHCGIEFEAEEPEDRCPYCHKTVNTY